VRLVIEAGGGCAATEAEGARWVNIVLSKSNDRWMGRIMHSASSCTPSTTWPRPNTGSIAAST
jgi:hypothetical protein